MSKKNADPICAFQQTKDSLQSVGIIVDEVIESYTIVEAEDVSIQDIRSGRLIVDQSGIYLIKANGQKHKGFLYKRNYFLNYGGVPKAHLCECGTIEEFKIMGRSDEYKWANSEPVIVVDIKTQVERLFASLPICKNCAELLRNATLTTTTAFVELQKELSKHRKEFVDNSGYVRDWPQISATFRKAKNYTCGRCGFHADTMADRQFIHVHHCSGDKLNNDESNLECLCIECHSEVNEAHRKNFSRGANYRLLEQFRKKHRKKNL